MNWFQEISSWTHARSPARLHGVKPEQVVTHRILLLKNTQDDCWEVLAKPAKRLKVGAISILRWSSIRKLSEEEFGTRRPHRSLHYQGSFWSLKALQKCHFLPYSSKACWPNVTKPFTLKKNGSVAAPTAGLRPILKNCPKRLSKSVHSGLFDPLHVGLGNLSRPVSMDNLKTARCTLNSNNFFWRSQAGDPSVR